MRRQLVLVTLATTLMVAIAFVVPLALLVRTVARDRALHAAEVDARALAPALAIDRQEDTLEAAMEATDAGRAGRMAILLPDGRRVGASVAEDRGVAAARRGTALSVTTVSGARVLVPVVLGRDGVAVVSVDVPRSEMDAGVARAWRVLALIAAGLVVAAAVVADRLGRGMVRPVEHLASAATRLGEGDLTTRVEPSGPLEVARVGETFNVLAGRIVDLLAAERELVADLSHRLRTPLMRLRLTAEAQSEGAGGAVPSRQLLGDLDALERAVSSVIEEARGSGIPAVHADLGDVVAARVEFWAALAEEEKRRWTLEREPGPHLVAVSPGDLAAAVDALIGNVMTHTPEATGFTVRVIRHGDGSQLVVEDEGPGFTDSATARGVSGAGSSGLGLDIARRTAERTGGTLAVDPPAGGGGRVTLRFGPMTGAVTGSIEPA